MKPACMDQAEFALWSRANATLRCQAGSPCHDCPIAFALTMRAEGRCDGEPAQTGRPRQYDPATEARRAGWRASQKRRTIARRVAA